MPVMRSALIVAVALGAANERENLRPASAHLTDKDTILLADFSNGTGDENFNGTFQQVLRVALDESPFLNVLSIASVAATLKAMSLPTETPITAEAARALCQRANGKAYVIGSISSQRSEFAIALRALECASDEMLAQAQATAQDRAKILDALEEAVGQLRLQLGEPLETLRKFTTPLPRATSAALAAQRAWSAGMRAEQDQGYAAAIPFLETAVKEDPSFASAYFRLGVIYRNSGQEARAREFLTKAFALRERSSVREKFNIAGLYYSFVTVDYEHAVGTYREWAKAYPRDEKPVSNLGSFYGDVCEYERAIAQFTEARRINPRNALVHENLIEISSASGQFIKAHQAYQEMQRMNLDTDAVHVFMYSLAVLEHDAKEAARQAAWFEDKPQFQHELLSEQADAEAYFGHLMRARQLTTQAVAAALRAGNKEQAAGWQLNSAWREGLFGNAHLAHDQAVQALTIAPDSREGEAVAAILLARTGDTARASAIASDLEKDFPVHTIVQSYWLPCIRAQIALASKRPALALRQLEKAKRYDTLFPQVTWYSHMPSVVLRAEAYLALDRPAAAVKEWGKILKYPGIVQLSATAPIARLQLARASARQKLAKAGMAYRDFFAIWKDADSDIPIFKEAKLEFAQLD